MSARAQSRRWYLVALVCIAACFDTGQAAAEVLRDPMRPPAPSAAATRQRASLVPTRVTALFLSANRRAAVVDGKLVREGERSGLCFVEAILEVGVRCRFPKGTRVVRIPAPEQSFKKPAALAVAATGVP